MRILSVRGQRVGCKWLTLIALTASVFNSSGQVNSWTKPTSGNWEEPQWSFGVLPGPDQHVAIDNPGWKAVQISWITSGNFPQSLNVRDLTISSPVDSYNTLLLNHAGFDVPLTVNYSITVASNSALTMHGSALNIATPTGVGLSVGGQVNQNDSSLVTGNQLDVGWIGPGVYNLNSGTLNVAHAWVGGPYGGVFNQNGGTNGTGIVHLEPSAVYNFAGGDFGAEVYFTENTTFRQGGGRLYSPLKIYRGQYILNGGVNYGDLTIPVYAEYQLGNAIGIQTGGTNLGSIYLGGNGSGYGAYALSNGVVQAPAIRVSQGGGFRQAGGTVSTPAAINVHGGSCCRGQSVYAFFGLDGGVLSSPGIDVSLATFTQTGGTNQIAGDLTLNFPSWYGQSSYILTGGLLTDSNTTVTFPQGGFTQSGGTHRIADLLSISDSSQAYNPQGYILSGGELSVPNIVVTRRARFERSGGTLIQSGRITLIASHIYAGPGTQQFGALALNSVVPSYGPVETNSTVHMPSNACVVRFRNSSAQAWPSDSTLSIVAWNGSYTGGGAHQIIFGNSSAALTTQQLRQISFRDPTGLSAGVYPTKILSTGEIVPDSLPTGRVPARLAIRKQTGGAKITLTGEAGYTYGILRSYSDFQHWQLWTNGYATNGTLSFTDTQTGPSLRFYRGVLMP